ncbi:flavoprotein [Actinoplanes auranticolor]|uniref:flavoprotein n=1 Tax=Actinoplanes auranticolor TaxID=47988 RepID=UPI001BB35782
MGKRLTIIVCGAGPADRVGNLVHLAQADGWTVQLVATAAAVPMLDLSQLETMTGAPIRTDYGQPRHGSRRSSAVDGLIIAPATYNTINKLASGINDTYPLNIAAEAIGRQIPVIIAPFVNTALAARRPFIDAVEQLRSEKVRVLLGAGEWVPHPPGTGAEPSARFPWHRAVKALQAAVPDV